AAKADAGIRLDEVIVGGIASQIAGEVLQGGGAQLRDLAPQLREYVLAFYRTGGPDAGRVVALEPGQSAEAAEAPKRATV
ncbi:MAG TPA: hypothetical protein VFI03_08820, partial [Solirubrobacterales bacterium]|nr:hypothetical protein [Solirubrobacterales bacterium]